MWEPAYKMRPHLTDLTIPDDGPLGPKAMAKLPPLDISPEEATLLGYMPQRDDFEKVSGMSVICIQINGLDGIFNILFCDFIGI